MSVPDRLDAIEASQRRIEAMLGQLLDMLAAEGFEEEEDEPMLTLDGDAVGGQRNGLEPL